MKRISSSFLPPIALDSGASTPMYQQLYEWFRRAILQGQLRPGQRVPSTRNLAAELKVSRIPVSSAYEQLQAEGYFETFVGAGTCVARTIPANAAKPEGGESRAVARPAAKRAAKRTAPRKISRRAIAMRMPPQSWLDNMGAFRVSLPALEQFPVGVWSKLVNRHSRRQPRQLMAYGHAMGYLPFREAIAEYLGTVRAVRCDASQILVTTGSQLGLQLSAQVLLDPDDPVWIEEPGYHGARHALMTAGAKLIPVPVDQEGLNIAEGIRRAPKARAVYITPSHQYPLGWTMSATRRMMLLNWATRSGAWIIEDDYDSKYRFGGRPIASLQGLDTDARVIYIGTFNKVVFPSWRGGYVVTRKDLAPSFSPAPAAAAVFPPPPTRGGRPVFTRGALSPRHIRRMRVLYAQ